MADRKGKSGKFSLKEILGKNELGWRLLIGLVAVLSLGMFLHFRQHRIESLVLSSVANRYVVAQVDFEFPDEEATIIFRQEALRDVGRIYKVEEKPLRQARFDFEDHLIHDQKWKDKVLANNTYEELYKTADALEDILFQSRFTDTRTLQKVKDFELPTKDYYIFTPGSTDEQVFLPREFWQKARSQLLDENHPKQAVQFVVQYFSASAWELTQDTYAQSYLRRLIEGSVPQKYSRIRAGTKIIDQGEHVSSRHLSMLQAMEKELTARRNLWEPLTLLASFILSIILIVLSALYFQINQPELIRSVQKLSLFVCIVVITLIFAKIAEYILLKNVTNMVDAIRYPLLVPFATILICILLSSRVALFGACFLSILLGVTLAVDHSRFIVINLVTSVVVIIFTRSLRKRKEVFGVCGKSWLSAIPLLFAFVFSENHLWSSSLLYDFMSTFLFMLVTAILVVGLLPILESLFHLMTDMSLMEFMDPNNDLLRRLALEMPGTYQHCLVLGNLAETAAQSIQANGLFCRVATLYHDIGKLSNPRFFTENQQGGMNIHELLTPLESAQVIISHVTDGEALAKKHRLPHSFIDIIRQHHGTTLVYYFYRKQLELKGGDPKQVDQAQFRYPGPKPKSKESAIIMIADTIEAASRSLEEVTEESLQEMVDRLVGEKADDGQFDECCLTFEELGMVKKAIIKTIVMTHHVRIKYPEREKKES